MRAASRYPEYVAALGAELGTLCRAHPDTTVRSCPDWTGADLLAHLVAYGRWLAALVEGRVAVTDDPPPVGRAEAPEVWDAELAGLVAMLREIDPDMTVPNWSVLPDRAGFWVRRTAQEFAVHRFDAATLLPDEPDPIPHELAVDGVAEFLDAFVATAIAAGEVPEERPATLRIEFTDGGPDLAADLPRPGPVTVVRGTASDVLLGLWHRRDPVALVVSGDRRLMAEWPHI